VRVYVLFGDSVIVRKLKRYFKELQMHDPFPSEAKITEAARSNYPDYKSFEIRVPGVAESFHCTKLLNIEDEVRSWILHAFKSGRLIRVHRDLMEIVVKVTRV
jgi:hypothetical protein